MKRKCPKCGGEMRVRREYERCDGTIAETARCKVNSCRKTVTYYKDTNEPIGLKGHKKRQIPEATIIKILESDETISVLSQQLGWCTQTIKKIRTGKLHAYVRPDIPRRPEAKGETRKCAKCIHWLKGRCSMDFPESTRSNYACICPLFEWTARTNDFSDQLNAAKDVSPKEASHELFAL